MEYFFELLTIAIALTLVAMSPGPAFIIVTQRSISKSRKTGLMTALGVTAGSLIWVIFVFLGLSVILQTSAWLYTVLKILGGLYLIYLGIQLWRGSSLPIKSENNQATSFSGTFMSSIWIQLLNPKAAVFFGSVFVTMMSPDAPLIIKMIAFGMVFIIEFGWYSIMAVLFSTKTAQNKYLEMKLYFERLAASWLIFFGLKLAASER